MIGLLGVFVMGGLIGLIAWTMAVEADSEKRHHHVG